jgi:hypothetical protein
MNQTKSRRLRKARFDPFFGDPEATVESLLKKLNDTSEDRAVVALRRLVEDMNAVEQMVRSRKFPDSPLFAFQFDLRRVLREWGFEPAVAERMERIRSAYDGFGMELMPVFPRKPVWIFQRLCPVRIDRALPGIFLATIHGLAEEGRLSQVRKCEICGKWFYAYRRSENYRFDRTGCRDKYYRHTVKGKAKRRTYMRDYRSRLRKGEKAYLEASKSPLRKRLK